MPCQRYTSLVFLSSKNMLRFLNQHESAKPRGSWVNFNQPLSAPSLSLQRNSTCHGNKVNFQSIKCIQKRQAMASSCSPCCLSSKALRSFFAYYRFQVVFGSSSGPHLNFLPRNSHLCTSPLSKPGNQQLKRLFKATVWRPKTVKKSANIAMDISGLVDNSPKRKR